MAFKFLNDIVNFVIMVNMSSAGVLSFQSKLYVRLIFRTTNMPRMFQSAGAYLKSEEMGLSRSQQGPEYTIL